MVQKTTYFQIVSSLNSLNNILGVCLFRPLVPGIRSQLRDVWNLQPGSLRRSLSGCGPHLRIHRVHLQPKDFGLQQAGGVNRSLQQILHCPSVNWSYTEIKKFFTSSTTSKGAIFNSCDSISLQAYWKGSLFANLPYQCTMWLSIALELSKVFKK